MMLLDDLFSETIGLHIIEPTSKIVKIKRVVPLPKFDMKKLKGKATQIEERQKEKEEKLKIIKAEVADAVCSHLPRIRSNLLPGRLQEGFAVG